MSGPISIVWINGTFGSGKTTVTKEFTRLLSRARVFDPELVGFVLRVLPGGRDYEDFQDHPLWRPVVGATALTLGRYYRSTLLVPMTVTNRSYFDEIVDTLRSGGAKVHPVRLMADSEVLANRIKAHRAYPNDEARSDSVRQWRLGHLAPGTAALADPGFGRAVDNGNRAPAATALDIVEGIEDDLDSNGRGVRRSLPTVAQIALILSHVTRHWWGSRRE